MNHGLGTSSAVFRRDANQTYPLQKSISFAKYIQSSPTLLKFFKPVANAYAQTAGYRQFGLRYDDLLEEENAQAQKVRIYLIYAPWVAHERT